jgi:hypothetical protein
MPPKQAAAKQSTQQNSKEPPPEVKLFVANYGYFAHSNLPSPYNQIILLWHADDTDRAAQQPCTEQMATIVKRAVSSSSCDTFLIVDVTALGKSLDDIQRKMTAEEKDRASAGMLGKDLSRPVARALARLQLDAPIFIAVGPMCRLLLKLLSSKDLRVLRSGSPSRAVLIHPHLPATTINALGGICILPEACMYSEILS